MPFNRFTRRWTVRTWPAAAVAGLVAIGMAAFSGQASAQITNGNFSTLPAGNSGTTYTLSTGPGGTNIPGWTTNVDTGGDPGCVVDGTTMNGCGFGGTTISSPANSGGAAPPYLAFMVDKIGGTNYSSSIAQNISLTASATYTLTFDTAAAENECGGSCTNNINWLVTVGGDSLSGNTSTTITLTNNQTTAWQAESVTFTAASTSAALTFLASSTTAGPPIALLDNISLACNTGCSGGGGQGVPEPASLALLGAGLAGVIGLRRRRAARLA